MIRTTLTTIFVFLSVFIIQAQTNCFIDLQAYGFPETTAGANDGSAISIVSSTYDLDNFDSGNYDPNIWQTVGGGYVTTASCGAMNGSALHFTYSGTRYAETKDLNLLQAQSVEFGLIIGSGGSCEDVDSGEEIVLEYSTNNGVTWTLITTYSSTSNSTWTLNTENLPLAAKTASTRLKWRQLSHSGSGYDEWSIDEVILNSGANISYLWSNGATTANINNLAPGTYTLTVSDQGTCQDTISVVIPAAGVCNTTLVTSNTFESYSGAFDGSASVIASGGVAPYSYNWSNGGTTSTISNLTAGSYFVYVVDAQGCTDTVTVFVGVCTLNLSLTKTDETSYQANDGTATASASGANGAVSYIWSTGDTTATIDSLAPGSYYYVTITDAAGCTDYGSIYIYAYNCNFSGIANVVHESSYQANDGSVSVALTGGVSPYNYSWSNGATTATISNLTPGSYSVTITDDKNCPVVLTTFVDSFVCSLDVQAFGFAASSPNYNDGAAQALVTGNAQLDDFNGTTVNNALWASTAGTFLNTNCGSISGNALHFQGNGSRYAETINLNALSIQTLDFYLIIGNGSISTCEDADTGEDVYLQYSTNNGVNWNNIATYYTNQYGSWSQISAVLPSAAKTGSTKFRFTQTSHSGSCCDHWAIDDFAINGGVGVDDGYDIWWSNGDTTENIFNLTPGTYTVYVTDTFNCADSATVTILPDSICNLVLTTYTTMESAANAFDGTASVVASNGVPAYQYYWVNGQTTSSIGNLSGGSYTVYVTDANGCTDTANAIVETCGIVATITSTNLNGYNWNDGTATVSDTGGTAPVTYVWSTGDTSATIDSLAPGTYYVTATDANGCQTVASTYISNYSCNLYVNVTGTNETAPGANDGTATAVVSGGTSPFTYVWTTGDTTSTIDSLAPNSYYYVTVTDSTNCTATDYIYIYPYYCSLSASFSKTNETTVGANDGTASISASGGTTPYTYNWSNGATTSSVSNLAPGGYYYTVTDAVGCEVIDSFYIQAAFGPNSCYYIIDMDDDYGDGWNGAHIDVYINGFFVQSFTFTSGYGAVDSIAFTTGDSIDFYMTSGSYPSEESYYVYDNGGNIVVSDGNYPTNGLVYSGYAVCVNCNISVSVTGTNETSVNANDGTATATANNPWGNVSYIWSNGGTTQTISNLAPGTYFVTVTDDSLCNAYGSVTIYAFSCNLTVNATGTNETAVNANDGTATATPTNGTAPYTYNWSNNGTTQTITGLSPGTYYVTVTDANGCAAYDNIYIYPFSCNVSATTTHTDETIQGANDGTATANMSGGTSPYTYSWSNNGTTQTISNLSPGTYYVTITDANGCTAVSSATIAAGINPNACYYVFNMNDSYGDGWNGAHFDVWVNGVLVSTFTFTSGYSAVDSIAVGTGDQMQIFFTSGSYPGEESFTVVDNNGVTILSDGPSPATGQIWSGTVNCTNCGMTVTVSGTNETSQGANDGTVSASVSGGTSPYSYLWNNGVTTTAQTGLNPGVYTVTVTDDSGCVAVGSYNVQAFVCSLYATMTTTDETALAANDGTASVTLTGGTSPYNYSWSNGQTTSSVANLAPGSYSVTVTDANNCTYVATGYVNQFSCNLFISVSSTDETAPNANDGTASVTVSSGSSPYSYSWSNGQTTTSINNLAPGSYTVTVTDAAGCTSVGSATVLGFNCNLTVTLSSTNESSAGAGDGTATATPNAAAFSDDFDNGTNSNLWFYISSGTLTNTNCGALSGDALHFDGGTTREAVTYDINTTNLNTIDFGIVFGSSSSGSLCEQADPGEDVVLEYSNNSGATWNTINTYYTTNHTTWSTISETVPSAAKTSSTRFRWRQVSFTGSTYDNFAIDEVELVQSSTTGYSYVWSNGATTSTITNLSAGTYTVTVTDGNGCTAQGTVIITSCNITTTITTTDESGNNYNDGTATISGSGLYSYVWSNGWTGNSINNLNPGTYFVSITDGTGCTAVDSAIINPYNCTLTGKTSYTAPSGPGVNDGTASAQGSGGTAPYSFIWSTGATSSSISGLSSSMTVSVTITDDKDCEIVEYVYIGAAGCNLSIAVTYNDASGPGLSDGDASVIVSNGNAPYTYYWSNGVTNNASTPMDQITGLSAGAYSITVLDADSCGDVYQFYVNDFPVSIQPSIDAEESKFVSMYPNPTKELVTLEYANTTTLELQIFNLEGKLMLIEKWATEQQRQINVQNWPSGVYYVKIYNEEFSEIKKLVVN